MVKNIEINKGVIVDQTLFNHTYDILSSGIDRVYGKQKDGSEKDLLTQKLKENIAHFATAKTKVQTQKWKDAIDSKAKEILPALNNKFNVNWLRTEYVNTVKCARAIEQWEKIQANKRLYPFLEYMPSRAAEPRNSHMQLYGIIKHVDDAFWDTWFPPSDWGCDCKTKQTRRDTDSREMPKDVKLPPPVFRQNPGKTKTIFNEQHPMIKNGGDLRNARENAKKELPFKNVVYQASGGAAVKRHDFYHKKDYAKNKESAVLIAETFNENMNINFHSDILQGDKMPELSMTKGNKLFQGDQFMFNGNNIASTLNNGFKKLSKEGQLHQFDDVFLVLNTDNRKVKRVEFADKLFGYLQKDKSKKLQYFFLLEQGKAFRIECKKIKEVKDILDALL